MHSSQIVIEKSEKNIDNAGEWCYATKAALKGSCK